MNSINLQQVDQEQQQPNEEQYIPEEVEGCPPEVTGLGKVGKMHQPEGENTKNLLQTPVTKTELTQATYGLTDQKQPADSQPQA